MRSPDAGTRSEAFHGLFGNIWHQGTVYEATAHAVPFLIELAVDAAQPERHKILRLLASLGSGSSFRERHAHMKLLDPLKRRSDWESELEKERGWVRAATQAVAAGTPQYFDLLDSPDRRVRESAAYLLGSLADRVEVDLSRLWRSVRCESDSVARFSLLVAVSTQELTTEQRQELAALLADADAVTRFGIAVALVRQPGASDHLAVALPHLLPALNEPLELDSLKETFWLQDADDSVASFAARALRSTPPTEKTIDSLLHVLPAQETQAAVAIAETLLALTFRRTREPGTQFNDLTSEQKRVLRVALESRRLWFIGPPDSEAEYGNTMEVFAAYGLPQRRQLLDEFINGRAPIGSQDRGGRIGVPTSGADATFTQSSVSAHAETAGWLRRWLKRFRL